MTLKETIEEIKTWRIKEKITFCNRLSQNITIGIRGILSNTTTNEKGKLEGIKWLNEFHHRINNFKFDLEKVISGRDPIDGIKHDARYYASKHQLSNTTISEAIRHSYVQMAMKKEKTASFQLTASIFELLNEANFRKRTGMYMGERKLSTLRGFLTGYFYAIDAKDILLREDEPKFSKFNDWVANHFNWTSSTAGWKNIILQECGGDEKLAVDKFFELYDNFKGKES